jgi:sRNA-binding carbon storage regulator CsrA
MDARQQGGAMKFVNLRIGQAVRIGDTIIKAYSRSGGTVRLACEADASIPIQRQERWVCPQCKVEGQLPSDVARGRCTACERG